MIQTLDMKYNKLLMWVYQFKIHVTNKNSNQTSTKFYEQCIIIGKHFKNIDALALNKKLKLTSPTSIYI